jgi:hypothetical protein
MRTGERTVTHPVVREKVQEMLDKEEKDFGGVLSTAKTALTLYSDPLVAMNTSASDFTINDLVNYERPVSLYLVVRGGSYTARRGARSLVGHAPRGQTFLDAGVVDSRPRHRLFKRVALGRQGRRGNAGGTGGSR